MRSGLGLAGAAGVAGIAMVVGSVLLACVPDPPKRWTCEAESDDCLNDAPSKKRAAPEGMGTNIGVPEPARPEDQEQPPPSATKSGALLTDAGTSPPAESDAGTPPPNVGETIPGPPPPPPPPPVPVLDASNACWSGTLSAWVEVNGCYQRKSDAMWFQCGFDTPSAKNAWFRNVVDGVGRFGACSSVHPLAAP